MASSKKPSHSAPPVVTPAKITRPVLSDIYPRTRLFGELDAALKKPIVWVCAPGGAGKTTLVASYLQTRKLPALWYQVDRSDEDIASFFYYLGLAAKAHASDSALPLLTQEYLGGLNKFTANYFRELFGHLKHRSVLVIDNCQDAGPQGKLLEILAEGFEQIPAGISVVVISRESASLEFARATSRGRVAAIGWDALRLTEEESRAIAELRNRRAPLTPDAIERLHVATQGWVAGLVLLTEHTQRSVIEREPVGGITSQVVFDYFANEVLRHREAGVQTVLLKTAFLKEIPVAVAGVLAANTNAGEILEQLTRRNLFTVQHANGNFEYHLLFRAFLIARANAIYSKEEVRLLKQLSARALVQAGEIEAAIALLLEAEDWEDAIALILKHARALHAHGRTRTLEMWLTAIPQSVRSENPWALYWLGMCRLPFVLAEARAYFEQAFRLFEKQDDATPVYLAWSRIIDTYLFDKDDLRPMIQWLDRYSTLQGNRKAPATSVENASIYSCLVGLTIARGDHPDLARYAERAERLLWNESDRARRLPQMASLMSYYLWRGDSARITNLLEGFSGGTQGAETRPLMQLNFYVWHAIYYSFTGTCEKLNRVLTDGLALAESSGVHLWDLHLMAYSVIYHLLMGDVSAARSQLQRMSALPDAGEIRDAFYGSHVALVAMHEGNIAQAIEAGTRSLQSARTSGMYVGEIAYLLGLIFAYARQGDLETALALLAEAEPKVAGMNSNYFSFIYHMGEANLRYLNGEEARAKASLQRALALAQENGFVTPIYLRRDDAARFYSLALEWDIFPDCVREIIRKVRLRPPQGHLPERWSWVVRLYTLGRFVVIKDNEPLVFSRKVQKKPLELLRALVAFGGRSVSVAKLSEALWPDTDADSARATLRSTLMRLRRLIGEEVILFEENHLSLNPECCWLDVWALEQLGESIERRSPEWRAEQLLKLYQGAFIADEEAPWAILQRDRLRSVFLRLVVDSGELLEAHGKATTAVPLYQRAIEVDPLAEEVYRRLMHCYVQLDRSAEALTLYQRCRQTLMSILGIDPSPETRALHSKIQSTHTDN